MAYHHRSIALLLFFLLSFPIPSLSGQCHSSDRKALLSIKSSMGDPYVIITWGQSSDCCQWIGVTCSSASGRVTRLDIFADTVAGTISPSIGDLTHLDALFLHKLSNLTGPIPPSLAKLTKLTFLRLDWNDLSGPVPAFLSNLTSLEYLHLAFNHFSGSIPPELSSLPLGLIRLDRNSLTGTIPASLGSSPCQNLYLSHNRLTGAIPASFSNASFQTLDLSRNKLSGDASLLFGESKAPQWLDLSRNSFEFDLTAVVLPKNLSVYLDINHNKIYGGIPEAFAAAPQSVFNVSYNRLCGKIPGGGWLDGLTQYEFFHNKCLCGPPLPTPCK